jgi:hypothetical protein
VQLSNLCNILYLNFMYVSLQHCCYSLHTQHQFECSPCCLADAACDQSACWTKCQVQHTINFERAYCAGSKCKCGKCFSSKACKNVFFKYSVISNIHLSLHINTHLSLHINLQQTISSMPHGTGGFNTSVTLSLSY